MTSQPSNCARYHAVTLLRRHLFFDTKIFAKEFFDCTRYDVAISCRPEYRATVVYQNLGDPELASAVRVKDGVEQFPIQFLVSVLKTTKSCGNQVELPVGAVIAQEPYAVCKRSIATGQGLVTSFTAASSASGRKARCPLRTSTHAAVWLRGPGRLGSAMSAPTVECGIPWLANTALA